MSSAMPRYRLVHPGQQKLVTSNPVARSPPREPIVIRATGCHPPIVPVGATCRGHRSVRAALAAIDDQVEALLDERPVAGFVRFDALCDRPSTTVTPSVVARRGGRRLGRVVAAARS